MISPTRIDLTYNLVGIEHCSSKSIVVDSIPVAVQFHAIDLMHNDVTRLDAREECWSLCHLKMSSVYQLKPPPQASPLDYRAKFLAGKKINSGDACQNPKTLDQLCNPCGPPMLPPPPPRD